MVLTVPDICLLAIFLLFLCSPLDHQWELTVASPHQLAYSRLGQWEALVGEQSWRKGQVGVFLPLLLQLLWQQLQPLLGLSSPWQGGLVSSSSTGVAYGLWWSAFSLVPPALT